MKRLLTICLLLICAAVSAQDVHFSQFFTNPLILNPSQTGYFRGNYRIGFNFKGQWPFAISDKIYNYHTEAPYVDFAFGEHKLKMGWFGLGLNFLNDEAGDGRLTYRRFGLSFAYHQAFDRDFKYTLSVGAVGNYSIRSVDFDKFYFNTQWVEDEGFNTSNNSQETFNTRTFGMFDIGAGLHFAGQVHEKVKINAGFAMLHINRPKHTFMGTDERLGFRYQANGGVDLKPAERITLSANFYYTMEKKASEALVGMMVLYEPGYRQNKDGGHGVYFGLNFRIKDALVPMAGYQYKNTRLILSYDVTMSSLSKGSRLNGGPEVSFVHSGAWNRRMRERIYCPKF
jgi:type IX secretion system PorP/SprF family membrane protein